MTVYFLLNPNGEIIGIFFCLIISFKISVLILFGIPTKPSSLASGITSMILFFCVCIEIASEPILFKEFAISLLKSIKTVSTIFMIFLSVTLRPLMNFD